MESMNNQTCLELTVGLIMGQRGLWRDSRGVGARAPLMGAEGAGRRVVAGAVHAATGPLGLADRAGCGVRRSQGPVPLDGVLEAPAGPVTPALVGEGAGLWSAGRQECDMPPGMSDVAPHLWMPVALRLLELLGDLQEGCCGGLNEHAYGPWDLYPWAVRTMLDEPSAPPQVGEGHQRIDLDELVREVAAGAEQDDGLRRLLRASLRMCGRGAQSRLCLPGFALEAVRGAMRDAVVSRPGGRPDVVDVAGQLLRRVVCQGDAAGCCLTPGIYCATMTQG